MRHRNQAKRAYKSPQSLTTDVELELAFVATAILVEVDELDNVNAREGKEQMDETSAFYFEL